MERRLSEHVDDRYLNGLQIGLKRLIGKYGSREALSKATGISQTNISEVFTGTKPGGRPLREQVSNLTGMSMAELWLEPGEHLSCANIEPEMNIVKIDASVFAKYPLLREALRQAQNDDEEGVARTAGYIVEAHGNFRKKGAE